MSELRVNNIVSEDGSAAPIYSKGMSIGAGSTLAVVGDLNVDGSVSFNSGATITGAVNFSQTNLNSNLGLSGNLTAVDGSLSGNLTAVDGTFSGDVSIGGTLTYEDVTNIDSVGLITARSGVSVTAGGLNVAAGTVYLSGVSKEKSNVTATTINSSATFDLNDGMVHFRNSVAPSSFAGNALLTYSPSNVNTFMELYDVLTVTIMCTGAAGSYFNGLSIDGVSQTVNWAGGSPPGDGSAKDMYVFTIVKINGSTYTIFGNQTKTA